MSKILVFDIFSEYGFFKKPWAITSPLTFMVPPYSTVAGMLGAIVGCNKRKLFVNVNKEEYLKVFSKQNFGIAVGIVNPLYISTSIISVGMNLLNTKSDGLGFNENLMNYVRNINNPKFKNINVHTQIRFDLIKNPRYRLYVTCFNDNFSKTFEKLCEYVKEHKSVYTVCMGLSEFIADLEFIGLFDYEIIKNSKQSKIPISSLIVKSKINNIYLQNGLKYMKEEKVPIDMTPERIATYEDIIYEIHGKYVICDVQEYCKIKELNVNVVFY